MKDEKLYMKLEILGGRAFLNHLCNDTNNGDGTPLAKRNGHELLLKNHVSGFQIQIFYKSQRFWTRPIKCVCVPQFHDTFMIELGSFKDKVISRMLTAAVPLKFILVREENELHGRTTLISYCLYDWRSVLMFENFSKKCAIELKGIGPEHNVSIGLLDIRISIHPPLNEQITRSTLTAHIGMEKCKQDERERVYLVYAKQWRKDFIEIRSTHEKRLVKLFAYNENMISKPVQTFVHPLKADRIITTPSQASWVVAQIPMLDKRPASESVPNNVTMTRSEVSSQWQTLESTLVSKSGRLEDHATLLCSLLLGFGLNCYVGLGSKFSDIPWAWMISFDAESVPTFWESITGKWYLHTPPPPRIKGETFTDYQTRIKSQGAAGSHMFKSIDCLFNHQTLFANIQNTTLIDQVDWNLMNPSKWKQLPAGVLQPIIAQPKPAVVQLRLPSLNVFALGPDLELHLKSLVSDARMGQHMNTKWDINLSQFLGQELARFEIEFSTGASNLSSNLQAIVMKHIPAGYDFKAIPFHFSCNLDAKNIFRDCLKQPKIEQILFCRGSDVKLAIRVEIFVYPEDVTSVHIMFACTYLST